MDAKVVYVGITGKRLLSQLQLEAIRPVVAQTIKDIVAFEQINSDSPPLVVGISPLAEGADTLFAQTILSLGHKLICYLPFEEQEYIKYFSNITLERQFKQLYDAIPFESKREIGYLEQGTPEDLYLRLGKKVVDRSDYVIAIWDEAPGKFSGTADVVRYLLEENAAQLWKHKWERNRQKKLIIITIHPPAIDVKYNFIAMGITNRTTYKPSLPIDIYEKNSSYDLESARLKRKYNRIWNICLWLGLFAALFFALKIAFKINPLCLSALEFTLIAGIALFIKFGKVKDTHSKFLLNRFIAEQIRVLKTYYWSGIASPKEFENLIFDAIKEHHKWDINILRHVDDLKERINSSIPVGGASDVRPEPIVSLINEQMEYHKRRYHRCKDAIKRNIVSRWVLLASFILVVFSHLVIESLIYTHGQLPWFKVAEEVIHHMHEGACDQWVVFLSLLLPALIARIEAPKVFHEWEKLSLQSNVMYHFFEEQLKKMEVAQPADFPMILNEINRQMFTENLDWQQSMMDKEPPPIAG